jgi:predicted alpha/beta-hydrolase family hydrolase
MDHPFLSFIQEALVGRGIMTIKFNFPYMEAGRKVPDPLQRLMRTWRAVIQRVREDSAAAKLFIGGKSMGGRIASLLVADGEPVSGLVLLGYPLHPAGRENALRVEHLARIRCPLLVIQGTRDRLGEASALKTVLTGLSAPWTLHAVEGGDHSFKVTRQAARTEEQVWSDIVQVVASWLTERSNAGPADAGPTR